MKIKFPFFTLTLNHISTVAAVLLVILAFAVAFGIVQLASWLVCFLWGITYTLKIGTGAFIVYTMLKA